MSSSLYGQWMDMAQAQRSDQQKVEYWNAYFADEKENYIKILDNFEQPYKGKLSELAKTFDMQPVVFTGFIDGINSSLAAGEYDLETLTEDSDIDLTCDLEKLYYNMLDAKAEWLYNLPGWDNILTPERRAEIKKDFKSQNTFIAEKTVGRNDPCPCGSGKKYKKCCGAGK